MCRGVPPEIEKEASCFLTCKSPYLILYSHPSIFLGDWFQEPKSKDAQHNIVFAYYLHTFLFIHILLCILNHRLMTYNTSYNVNAMQTIVTLYCLRKLQGKKNLCIQYRGKFSPKILLIGSWLYPWMQNLRCRTQRANCFFVCLLGTGK